MDAREQVLYGDTSDIVMGYMDDHSLVFAGMVSKEFRHMAMREAMKRGIYLPAIDTRTFARFATEGQIEYLENTVAFHGRELVKASETTPNLSLLKRVLMYNSVYVSPALVTAVLAHGNMAAVKLLHGWAATISENVFKSPQLVDFFICDSSTDRIVSAAMSCPEPVEYLDFAVNCLLSLGIEHHGRKAILDSVIRLCNPRQTKAVARMLSIDIEIYARTSLDMPGVMLAAINNETFDYILYLLKTTSTQQTPNMYDHDMGRKHLIPRGLLIERVTALIDEISDPVDRGSIIHAACASVTSAAECDLLARLRSTTSATRLSNSGLANAALDNRDVFEWLVRSYPDFDSMHVSRCVLYFVHGNHADFARIFISTRAAAGNMVINNAAVRLACYVRQAPPQNVETAISLIVSTIPLSNDAFTSCLISIQRGPFRYVKAFVEALWHYRVNTASVDALFANTPESITRIHSCPETAESIPYFCAGDTYPRVKAAVRDSFIAGDVRGRKNIKLLYELFADSLPADWAQSVTRYNRDYRAALPGIVPLSAPPPQLGTFPFESMIREDTMKALKVLLATDRDFLISTLEKLTAADYATITDQMHLNIRYDQGYSLEVKELLKMNELFFDRFSKQHPCLQHFKIAVEAGLEWLQ